MSPRPERSGTTLTRPRKDDGFAVVRGLPLPQGERDFLWAYPARGGGVCIERLAGTPTVGVRAAPAAWPGFMNFTSTR